MLTLGSPPQVRGKLISTVLQGITQRDHPRRCGENLEDKMRVYIESRITPAGAGKTFLLCHLPEFFQDHPRRCGENVNRVLIDF